MGRIVRLTESDLTRIVRRVISEQDSSKYIGTAQKIAGMIMTATGVVGTDEAMIASALKLIKPNGGQPVYDALLKIVKTSPKINSQYGRNFNTVMDMIKTDFFQQRQGMSGDADVGGDEVWLNSYYSILKQYNSNEPTAGGKTTNSGL